MRGSKTDSIGYKTFIISMRLKKIAIELFLAVSLGEPSRVTLSNGLVYSLLQSALFRFDLGFTILGRVQFPA
jgi:hypothetical protein